MIRHLHFAGRALRLRVSGPVSQELVNFMFGALPNQGLARAHITFDLRDEPGGELRFTIPALNTPETRGPAGLVANRLLFEVDYHLADRCRAGLFLHTACLEKDGRVVLLPASSGSGKSTLACWLAMHGYHYLGDEAAFVAFGALECSAFTRPAHLKTGSFAVLPSLQTAPRQEVLQHDGSLLGYLVELPAFAAGPSPASLPIDRLVFPHYTPGASLLVTPLTPARAAFLLAGCLTNARNLPGDGFPEIVRLARSLPAWQVIYGDVSQTGKFFG